MWRRGRRLALVFLLALPLVALIAAALPPRPIAAVLSRLFPGCLYHVADAQRDGRPLVALTIDDSPDSATTAAILDTLKAYGARATFFVITGQIARDSLVLRRMVAEGHEIGNHFTEDRPSILLDSVEFERDLAASDSALRPFAAPRWARPGAGWYSPRMARQMERAGYRCALASVYPVDTALPWVWFAERYIVAHVYPGAVVVMHDRGSRGQRTARVLGRVLGRLRGSGYEFVSLRELAVRVGMPR